MASLLPLAWNTVSSRRSKIHPSIGAEPQSALDPTAHSDGRKMIDHHQEPSVYRHVCFSPSRDAVKGVVDT